MKRILHFGMIIGAVLSLTSCGGTIARCGRPGYFMSAPPIEQLDCQSEWGDKQAQLALGIRYEEGDGVPRDLDRAKKLYRLAAHDSGGRVYGSAPNGGVTVLSDMPIQHGLKEAKERLRRLK